MERSSATSFIDVMKRRFYGKQRNPTWIGKGWNIGFDLTNGLLSEYGLYEEAVNDLKLVGEVRARSSTSGQSGWHSPPMAPACAFALHWVSTIAIDSGKFVGIDDDYLGELYAEFSYVMIYGWSTRYEDEALTSSKPRFWADTSFDLA